MKGRINKMDINIRKMEKDDIKTILEIERESFTTPWSEESFELEITKNQLARYIVAELGDRVVGYGGIWLILDEGHITNIAVKSEYRGRDIGKALVEGLIYICSVEGINNMTLEARVSNVVAINLYKKYGFIESGIRPNYYLDDNEDAIIMWKKL